MIKVLSGVKEISDLGRAVVKFYNIDIPDVIEKYVNYSDLGKDFHRRKEGIFHNNEYIFNENAEQLTLTNGDKHND